MHAPTALHLEQTHRLDAMLAVVTLVLGGIGVLLVVLDADDAAVITGAVGVLCGLWGQMISRTRSERFLDVIGFTAAALAVALGAAFGGLSG